MTEHALSVTLKAGTGYDAPWIVVYGDSPDEVTAKLNSTGDLIAAAVEASNLLRGAFAAAPLAQGGPSVPQVAPTPAPAAAPGWGAPQQQAPAPAAPPAGGAQLHPEGKTCQCGNVLNYKVVNRRSDGKQFRFWECPARTGSKDTQHHSEFAD